VVHGLSLATITRRWFVQASTTWAVRKRGRSKPSCRIIGSITIVWLTKKAYDQSSLHCVIVSTDRYVLPYWAPRCKRWRWMRKDISMHRPIWMGFDGLKHIVNCRFTRREGGAVLLSTGSHESCMGCRQPEIRRIEL